MSGLTIKLDEQSLRRLTEAAQRAGVTPERMAEMVLEAYVRREVEGPAEDRPDGVSEPVHAWVDEHPATTPADFDGPFVELDEALDAFDAELERRLASPTG